VRLIYEVVCTYSIEAEGWAAAEWVAGVIARSVADTGALQTPSIAEGTAMLLEATPRFRRIDGAS
jgi:hypothetical protein